MFLNYIGSKWKMKKCRPTLGRKGEHNDPGCTRRRVASGQGHRSPPLLWRREATCQVLCSLLGFPAQGRHGSTGEGPVEGYRDGEGTEERLRELDLFSLKMFTSLSVYKYLKDT